jgi:hypothetical protein
MYTIFQSNIVNRKNCTNPNVNLLLQDEMIKDVKRRKKDEDDSGDGDPSNGIL